MYNKKLWEKCVEFHGHECPGLAIGFKVSEAARKKLKIDFSKDEEIVCVSENDSCSVDAIQVILGCSVGKGNLIFQDRGKQAFSIFNRTTGESTRIVLKNSERKMDRNARKEFLLNSEVEDIIEFKEANFKLPIKAKIFNSVTCESCGEKTSENKMRLCNGKKVCLDCFEEYSRGW